MDGKPNPGEPMSDETVLRVPERAIPIPTSISAEAQAMIAGALAARAAGSAGQVNFPPQSDKEAWRALIAMMDQGLLPMLKAMRPDREVKVEDRTIAGVRVFDISPADLPADDRTIVLDMHGGGLFLCGGELCQLMAENVSLRLNRRVWAVDYRMLPDHPYPAALDDGIAVYKALLEERSASEIVFHGASAGGNLAPALLLRARDEGLPIPAAMVLHTPEIDLTESGDSFATNDGVDAGLSSLMPVNLFYANGHDLRDPYISPLFGDFTKGFAPTVLTTGTRDLFLSNTVLMHRALRDAGITAELHVYEAGGHGGFPSAPEGVGIERDVSSFVATALAAAQK